MRIGEIKGVGEKTEALFGKLHITTTRELIQFFPRAYDHFEKEITLGEAVSGQLCSIQAVIMSHPLWQLMPGEINFGSPFSTCLI